MLNARMNESISQSSPEAEVGAALPTVQLPLLSNELRRSENWESSTVDGGFDRSRIIILPYFSAVYLILKSLLDKPFH